MLKEVSPLYHHNIALRPNIQRMYREMGKWRQNVWGMASKCLGNGVKMSGEWRQNVYQNEKNKKGKRKALSIRKNS
jgi:hypothetical protein